MVVVYGFRLAGRSCPIVSRQFLNGWPIRKQPSFKIMLRNMGMETIVRTHPVFHFLLGIFCILKILRACVDIRERNHVVCVRIITPE